MSTKLKFDRTCEFRASYYAIAYNDVKEEYEKTKIAEMEYRENGILFIKADGMEHTIEGVNELIVNISELDSILDKVTFKIAKMGKPITISNKFYGVRGTNYDINYVSELSGVDDESN